MEHPFNFPFEPYKVQLDFMTKLYETLSTCKVGIFESPTGTGKSLSLICSSFLWLRDHQPQPVSETFSSDDDMLVENCESSSGKPTQFSQKLLASQIISRESDFSYENSHEYETQKINRFEDENFDSMDWIPKKIIYTSRTHSQLDQFIGEIKRTVWGTGPNKIKVIRVGSRKQLCINPDLKIYKNSKEINQKCKELFDEETKECSCPWFEGAEKVAGYGLSEICDIEDLITAGYELNGCPYYGSRRALQQSEVIVAPYASVLNERIRELSNIPLENSILIIDEAHNLMESIIEAYSATMLWKQIVVSQKALNQYFNAYHTRMNPESVELITEILKILEIFNNFIKEKLRELKSNGTAIPAEMFLEQTGLINYDYKKILEYIEINELARKLTGFAENYGIAQGDTTYFHSFIDFLECFQNFPSDSSIIFDKGEENGQPRLKYLLLNPAMPFKSIIDKTYCIILAGGTIEPLDEFLELFEDVPRIKISFFNCGHVIPKENLLVSIVSYGESGNSFKFNYQRRDDDIMLNDLCKLLFDVSLVVPHGIVVFLPSFSFLQKLRKYLQDSGYHSQIQNSKTLFFDNRNVNNILTQYSQEAMNDGAILFAVVRGKLSEGINFNDELGRCVIMVGLPYLSCVDLEVKERMRFLDSLNGNFNGRKFYEMNCHKAINQSIGRAIRHKSDYAVILLVDHRHSMSKRPIWMRSNCIDTVENPKDIISCIIEFFYNKNLSKSLNN